jgi:hypothetical protein
MSVPKTTRRARLGKLELELVARDGRFFGLADRKQCVAGSDAEKVWRQLQDDAGKSDPKYFGYDGARNRFLRLFPGGFHTKGFEEGERNYKLAAKRKLDSTIPLEQALAGSGLGEAALAAFRATNMLSPFEMMRVQELLRGPDGDAVVRTAAAFAQECDKSSLRRLESVLKLRDCAKWTVATYLPFLWRPDHHMFLKPEVTKDYAARVGHPFASVYAAGLNYDVYASLLDLVDRTASEIADLLPRDRIDLQGFIWAVGTYPVEGRNAP